MLGGDDEHTARDAVFVCNKQFKKKKKKVRHTIWDDHFSNTLRKTKAISSSQHCLSQLLSFSSGKFLFFWNGVSRKWDSN